MSEQTQEGNKAGGSSWPVIDKVRMRVLCTFLRVQKGLRPGSSHPLHLQICKSKFEDWVALGSHFVACDSQLQRGMHSFLSVISNSQKY